MKNEIKQTLLGLFLAAALPVVSHAHTAKTEASAAQETNLIQFQCFDKKSKSAKPDAWKPFRYYSNVRINDSDRTYDVAVLPDCDPSIGNGSFYIRTTVEGGFIQPAADYERSATPYSWSQNVDLKQIGKDNANGASHTLVQTLNLNVADQMTLVLVRVPRRPSDQAGIKFLVNYGSLAIQVLEH